MNRQALRDWVLRYKAEGIDALHDRARSGRPSFLDEGQMAVFRGIILRGPNTHRDGISSWSAKDPYRVVEAKFGITYRESGMLKLLHCLGLFWQKTRPSDPKTHAVFIMDRAGWCCANALAVPSNLPLAFLPPYSPELTVIERVWLYLKENYLSHRVLPSYEAILDAVGDAWNKLVDEPRRLESLTHEPWLAPVKT
ncbi:MAG: transposase [Pseudomonadota bacterium]